MELFTLQKSIKEMMGGDEKDGGGGIMSEVLEAVKAFRAMNGAPGAPRRLPNAPAPAATPIRTAASPAPVAPPNPEDVPMSKFQKKLDYHLPTLIEYAQEGRDVEKTAGWLITVLDNDIVPALVEKHAPIANEDMVWSQLIEAAGKPADVQKIFDYAPALEPHREWVAQVIARAVKEMSPEEVPANNGNGNPA